MYTLALDTTGYKIHLALFKNSTIVFERDWRSNMNEDETITKTLQHLSGLEPFYLQKLSRIFINEGPGTLTGTRVGVSIANALSFACKAPLVKLTTSQIWKARLPDEGVITRLGIEAKKIKPHLLLRITEQDIYLDDKITPYSDLIKQVKKLKKQPFAAYGELTPTQFSELNKHRNLVWIMEPELTAFSSAISSMLEKNPKGDKSYAKPKYAALPVITESKKEVLIPRSPQNSPKKSPVKKPAPVKNKPTIAKHPSGKKLKPAIAKHPSGKKLKPTIAKHPSGKKSKPSTMKKLLKKVTSTFKGKKKSKR